MKRVVAVVISLLMVLAVVGCSAAQPAAQQTTGSASSASDAQSQTPGQSETAVQGAANEGFFIEWANQQYGLTAEQIEKIKAMKLRFAIEVPTQSDFGNGQIRGFKDTCAALGIEAAGVATNELDPSKQQQNMEDFISMGVKGIVCQAQEAEIAAKTFDPVVKAGIKLAYTGSVPKGYTAGKEYVTMISDDFVGEGKMQAQLLEKTVGKGDVLSIYISSVNFVSNTRDGAFFDELKNYSNLNLVEKQGIELANQAGEATSAMLARHPNAAGMNVTFSGPAVAALEVIRNLGLKDFKIVTQDLDTVCCLDMINKGNIAGIVCDSAYYYASAGVIALAKSYLGEQVPAILEGPGKIVTTENMAEMWKWSFGEELPQELKDALAKKG